MTEKTIVRENLMNEKGYTPYCGANDCDHHNPRTVYSKEIHQFRCICGWISEFPKDFIEKYEQRWNPLTKEESVPVDIGRDLLASSNNSEVAEVATLRSTDSNTDDLMNERVYELLDALCQMWNQYCGDKWGHAFMSAGENCAEVLDRYCLLKNDNGTGGEVDWDRLEFLKQLLNIKQGAHECEANTLNQGEEACNKIAPVIDWEGLHDASGDFYTPEQFVNWLKNNLTNYIK